jgi:hypothetical protein
MRFVVYRNDSGTGFSLSTSAFSCQYSSTNDPCSSSLCFALTRRINLQSLTDLPWRNDPSGLTEHWIEK